MVAIVFAFAVFLALPNVFGEENALQRIQLEMARVARQIEELNAAVAQAQASAK